MGNLNCKRNILYTDLKTTFYIPFNLPMCWELSRLYCSPWLLVRSSALAPGLLVHVLVVTPELAHLPAAPPLSPQLREPLRPLPLASSWAEMDGEASAALQTAWFMAPPFHPGSEQASGGLAWRALGTAAVSDLTALGSRSTVMPSTKRPLQNGRHPSCRRPGTCLKELKHREQEQWEALPGSLAASNRHWSALLLFIISPLWGLLSGGRGCTSMLLSNAHWNHYKYRNIMPYSWQHMDALFKHTSESVQHRSVCTWHYPAMD